MAAYDHKFEIIQPDWGQLIRFSCTVADPTLLNPTNSNAFIDGEFMQLNNVGKLIRGATDTKPSFPLIDDRGDTGVQAHKKPTIILGPRGYRAKTVVYADALAGVAFGTYLETATVNISRLGGVARWGLQAYTSKLKHGIVLKAPAVAGNNAPLEYLDLLI